ncbi:VIT and vWA domain-containing protein [Amphritea balenae]|uniref:VWA domain-containing protein n=1 Tax=Amphritea balenae TaxID=452629 RepID=A0A3P1SID5_9GAMM|nr:VIT domain-containing protein [Amphritea balenae]RRC97041.1 VWA domain-containing protein [Amphritea balenae]GGK67536.1 hypothetical protein GCM10007941_17020 [Amphritea balenae]
MNIKNLPCAIALSTALTLGAVVPEASAAGLMSPVNSGFPELSIKEHHVQVTMEDSYAVTSVEQIFHNPANQSLDAIYSFPVPEHAAVGEFTYWIDGKPVTGEVVKKQQAREIYEQEKQAGHETALVEKDSYKTFDINVASVQPNSDVRVKLVYIQPTHIDSGIGRYLYPLEDGGVDEHKNAFWNRNEVVDEKFSFNMTVRSGYPIDSVRLPKHTQATIKQLDSHNWQISMSNNSTSAVSGIAEDSAEQQQLSDQQQSASVQNNTVGLPAANLDEDILVYWRHSQNLPGSLDLVSYKESNDKTGTFMMTLTPGDDLGETKGGRDWVFVLDVSGSMKGKYSTLVEGVRQGLNKLQPQDRFKIVLFNSRTTDFTQGFISATPEQITPLLQQLEQYQPGSGTDLYSGIARGLKGLDADRSTAMILVTDGVANVGVTEKKRFLKLMDKADIRLFTFVMGNSANRPLLDGMANISNGFAISVSNADDIVGQLMLATSKMTHQALRDIKLEFDGSRITDLTPEQINSVYRGEQLTVLGHYRKPGPVKVTLSAMAGDQPRRYSTEIILPKQNLLHPELERLWAYASIENLQATMDYLGEDADTKQAITDLALQYDLVTDYTSMLVVRDETFTKLGINRDNQQRTDKERKARIERAQQPVIAKSTDNQQPMFNPSKNRASLGTGSGGSGAIGHWVLLLIGIMLLIQFSNNRNRNKH